jgi:hypothetical protein
MDNFRDDFGEHSYARRGQYESRDFMGNLNSGPVTDGTKTTGISASMARLAPVCPDLAFRISGTLLACDRRAVKEG